MKRSSQLVLAVTFALVAPLTALVATAQRSAADDPTKVVTDKVVTDADNGGEVTLKNGEVLVVRLKENATSGYSRALVAFSDMPVRLVSDKLVPAAPLNTDAPPIVGAPRVREWKFEVNGEATYNRAVWLKFLNLRPFAKGVDTTGLWEVKVTVAP